ncbi:MAG: hypothetical protein AB7C98_08540 [Acidithiobacillus sp.]
MLHVFFDTEFTDLGIGSKLISIGLVTEDGDRQFYAELTGTYELAECCDFVRETVLPQLEGGSSVRMDMPTLTHHLGVWLLGLGESVQLVTDSLAWDWPWVQGIFWENGSWPRNVLSQPLILGQTEEMNEAIETAFAQGLRQHHALDDAKANRLAWLSIQREN